MDTDIPYTVQQTPSVGDDNTFITGSKLSGVISIDTVTGIITKLSGICDGNGDTCQNITTLYDTPNNNSLLLVLNEYKLSAISLITMKGVWNIVYSELLDVTNKEENLVLSSSHLGYDLCLKGLTTLQAIPQVFSGDDWEFKTKSPIAGVYQVIRGARFVKIQLCSKSTVKGKMTIYNYSSTLFAMETQKGEISSKEYQKVSLPFVHSSELEELDKEPNIFAPTYTKLVMASFLGIVTAIIIFTVISRHGKSTEEKTEANEIVKKRTKNKESMVQVGKLFINTNVILGYGSLGTIVYEGKLDHRTVAIKRMLKPFHEVATKEISALIVADNHPRVIRYFTKEEDR